MCYIGDFIMKTSSYAEHTFQYIEMFGGAVIS